MRPGLLLLASTVLAGAPPRHQLGGAVRTYSEQRYLNTWTYITDLISIKCEVSDRIRKHQYKIYMSRLYMLVFKTDRYFPYAMSVASRLIPKSPHFNKKKKTVIYIHGFNGYANAIGVTRIGLGVESKGGQFMSYDIENYISGYDYFYIGGLIKHLGWILGDFVSALYQQGMPVENIHLVGLSLGAQVASFACKLFNERHGVKLARFTALDPTAQCYSLTPSIGINPADAKYVDIIHTSVLSYTRNFKGHAEYYINNRKGEQPGCRTLDLSCSHSRALHLFGDTVMNEKWFPAMRCRDIAKLDCQRNEISLMGYGSQPTSRGDYLIRTTEKIPFGLGYMGLQF